MQKDFFFSHCELFNWENQMVNQNKIKFEHLEI